MTEPANISFVMPLSPDDEQCAMKILCDMFVGDVPGRLIRLDKAAKLRCIDYIRDRVNNEIETEEEG